MQHLRDQIASVEKLRGVGRDGKLRLVTGQADRLNFRFNFLFLPKIYSHFSGDLDNLEQVLAVVKFEKSDT